MLCPLQVESNQLHVVYLFEAGRAMIPKNEALVQRQDSAKELSWMDRMQLKLESLCEVEAARNHNHLMQDTSAYFEKQMTTVGTNMRKFCAEFVKELLLPETPEKVEGSQDETLETDIGLDNGLQTGTEKQAKLLKPAKLVDAPIFDIEGSISGSSFEVGEVVDQIAEVQPVTGDSKDAVPSNEATKSSLLEDSLVVPTVNLQSAPQQSILEEDAEQYAHWFVSEEYRTMRLGKSISASSLQSCDGLHQRAASSDSLVDWELI